MPSAPRAGKKICNLFFATFPLPKAVPRRRNSTSNPPFSEPLPILSTAVFLRVLCPSALSFSFPVQQARNNPCIPRDPLDTTRKLQQPLYDISPPIGFIFAEPHKHRRAI